MRDIVSIALFIGGAALVATASLSAGPELTADDDTSRATTRDVARSKSRNIALRLRDELRAELTHLRHEVRRETTRVQNGTVPPEEGLRRISTETGLYLGSVATLCEARLTSLTHRTLTAVERDGSRPLPRHLLPGWLPGDGNPARTRSEAEQLHEKVQSLAERFARSARQAIRNDAFRDAFGPENVTVIVIAPRIPLTQSLESDPRADPPLQILAALALRTTEDDSARRVFLAGVAPADTMLIRASSPLATSDAAIASTQLLSPDAGGRTWLVELEIAASHPDFVARSIHRLTVRATVDAARPPAADRGTPLVIDIGIP